MLIEEPQYVAGFQVKTELSHELFMPCFLKNVNLLSIFLNLVMLKRKSVILLPAYLFVRNLFRDIISESILC